MTYTSQEELKKDMGYLDPGAMCMRVTLPGKGVPAGWHLQMSKKARCSQSRPVAGETAPNVFGDLRRVVYRSGPQELGQLLQRVYKDWPGTVRLTFEAPPEEDELEGLSPRSVQALRLANAAQDGDLVAVRRLAELEGGICVDQRLGVKGRNSALNLAARGGHLEVMALLLERRADVNSRNDFRETPLLCAANRARAGACQLLLQWRADLQAVDENGDGALDFLGPGRSEKQRRCREVLQAAGCQRRC